MTEPSDAARQIDAKIAALDGWRGDALARVRALIHEAIPDVVETVKWGGTAVWEHQGILTTGEVYKDKIKLTFAKGASLDDPAGLFNSSLDGNTRRAVDIRQGAAPDAEAFRALIRAAAALNAARTRSAPRLRIAP